MIDFVMPSLGADMEMAALVGWFVEEGDEVSRGQVVAEVETDKGIIEIECWHNGVVDEILIAPGPRKFPVGTPLARIRADAEESGDTRTRVSPRARAAAKERGLDLRQVRPGRADGLITTEDLEAASDHDAPPDGLTDMRRAIARSMERSKREIPHYYLATHIDLEKALTWLDGRNEDLPIARRILPVAILARASALSLGEVPELNGHWVEGAFRRSDEIHLGVAVSLRGGGLVAPAIHGAAELSLDEMMARLRDLVIRARSGRLRSSEMTDATITITNLGDRGVETAFPVIIPPQVAMIAFGRIAEHPFAGDGEVEVHRGVHATLAGDHRVTDGHRGGLFLEALDRLLQTPEEL